MVKTKEWINLPMILDFNDYHDIDYVGESLKKIVPKIKWTEGPMLSSYYSGFFYIGKRPTKKELKELYVKKDMNYRSMIIESR